jgi:hypothetical protein
MNAETGYWRLTTLRKKQSPPVLVAQAFLPVCSSSARENPHRQECLFYRSFPQTVTPLNACSKRI